MTRVLNTRLSRADLAQQLGALGNDASTLVDAGHDEEALSVERVNPHRADEEAFGRHVLEDDMLAVGRADDAGGRKNDPGLGRGTLQDHSDRRSHLQGPRLARNAKQNRHRLLPQGEAAADEVERQRLAIGGRGHSLPDIDNRCRVIGDGLDPQLRRIDDLEEDFPAVDELAGDDVGDRDHARGRGADDLPLGQRRRQDPPALLQAFQFASRLVDLTLRHAAPELGQARHALLGNGDITVDLRQLLAQAASFQGGDDRLNSGKRLPLGHLLPDDGKTALRRLDAAALGCLHPPAGARIRDHPTADRVGPRRGLNVSRLGTHGEEALRRLRHEQAPVRKPPRAVRCACRWADGSGAAAGSAMVFVAMRLGSAQRCTGAKKRQDDSRANVTRSPGAALAPAGRLAAERGRGHGRRRLPPIAGGARGEAAADRDANE